MLHQLKLKDAAKGLLRWLRSRESSEPESKTRGKCFTPPLGFVVLIGLISMLVVCACTCSTAV